MQSGYTLLQFREMVRRTVLTDPTGSKWDDPTVLDYLKWSLDTLCQHTAYPKSFDFVDGVTPVDPLVPDGEKYDTSTAMSYTLPSDIYEDIHKSGVVKVEQGGTFRILDPILFTRGMEPTRSDGYRVWPDDVLILGKAPGTGATVTVRYFAHWPYPVEDTDSLVCPRWSITALSYLVGMHALTKFGIRSADIRQWASGDDKGNPEDNSLRIQQEWMKKQFEHELLRHPRQSRENFFRGMN